MWKLAPDPQPPEPHQSMREADPDHVLTLVLFLDSSVLGISAARGPAEHDYSQLLLFTRWPRPRSSSVPQVLVSVLGTGVTSSSAMRDHD